MDLYGKGDLFKPRIKSEGWGFKSLWRLYIDFIKNLLYNNIQKIKNKEKEKLWRDIDILQMKKIEK